MDNFDNANKKSYQEYQEWNMLVIHSSKAKNLEI